MKHLVKLGACIALSGWLTGCTTAITSERVDSTSDQTGIVYQLPATQLKLTAKFELSSCVPVARVRLREIEIAPVVVTDRSADATYIIKTGNLKNWLKQVDSTKVTLASSRLSKVSYDVTDKTKGAISQAVSVVKKIGALSNPTLAAFSIDKFSKTSSLCKPGVIAALNHMLSLQDRTIPTLQESLLGAYAEFSIAPTDDNKKKIQAVNETLTKAINTVNSVRNGELLVSFTTAWNPSRIRKTTTVYPHATTFSKWFRDISDVDQNSIVMGSTMKIDVSGDDHFRSFNNRIADTKDGVFYRIPGHATVKVFEFRTSETDESKQTGRMLFETELPILQLGLLAKLDLSNALFEDNKYDIVFGADGELQEFAYAESVSRISELGSAISSALDSKLSEDEEAIDRQISLLGKQNELLKAELEILNAQTALESKIEELSKDQDGSDAKEPK